MRLRWWFRSPYVQHFSVNRVTRERAKGARRRPLHNPGSRQRKSPLRGLFAPSLGLTPTGPAQALFKIAPGNFVLSLFLQAFGSGIACIHAGYALSARPCASPRPSGNASAIFSRTREPL